MQTLQFADADLPSQAAAEDCLAAFCRAPQQFLLNRARTHGPISFFRLNDELFATLSDPEVMHYVFRGSMEDFEKGPIVDAGRAIFGYGLFSADREDWTMQSKAITPIFARQRLRHLSDTIHGRVDRQIELWRSRGVHEDDNALIALKRLAFDVVAITLFNLNDEEQRDVLFDGLYQLDRLPMVSLQYLGKRVPVERLSGIVATGANTAPGRMARTNELLYAIVDERLAASEQAEDVIGALLANPAISALPLERRRVLVRDEIASILVAGYVSTGESMFWALYQLARHPEVQVRAREDVLATGTRLVDAPPYLAAVINESMRLYPPAWFIGRTTLKPMELSGVDIPVGTRLVCSPFVVHRLESLWPEPERFLPERFLPGGTIVPRSYIPFSSGARSCLGRALSLMEQTSLVSGVLANFDLEMAVDPPVVTLPGSYSMQPRERISIRFRPRS